MSDENILAVDLVPSLQQRLEQLVINFEENPHSNLSFYGVMGYMDALIDMKVFPVHEINVARIRLSAALKTNQEEDY